jgi:hypothetical protein
VEARRPNATFLDGTDSMLTLHLSDAEQAVMRDVLENALSELSVEISGTDTKEYRDDLKDRREMLHKLLADLGGATGS